jgi:hypothetical protein
VTHEPGEQLNRFLIILVALLVIFAAAGVIALAWAAPGGTIDRIANLAGWLNDRNNRDTKIVITLAGAVVVLLMLMAIILELTPPSTRRMRVRNVKSGEASISTTEIARRVNAEVEQVEHIAACQAIIAAHGRRVEVVLDLHVDAGADLSHAADEACARTQQLVEQQINIEMTARPRARLHYRELRLLGERQPLRGDESIGRERPATAPEGELDQRGQSEAS